MASYGKTKNSWKQKKANIAERDQRTNAVLGMLQNSRSDDKVKERFYRKPYGKKEERIDICKNCFGASNDDCQRCPHNKEIEYEDNI